MSFRLFRSLRFQAKKAFTRQISFAVGLALIGSSLTATMIAHAAYADEFSQACGNTGTPGPVQHVIWIWMENESFNSVIGSPNAPYQTSLAKQCGTATDFYNESHASLDNYIAATDGQNVLSTSFLSDCLPNVTSNYCVSTGPSIFSQVQAAGMSWRNYAEDMPSNCYLGNSGNYTARHVPAVYYTSLTTCSQYAIPMGSASTETGQFYTDLSTGDLPNFSFISPNMIDDAHSSSTATGDAWLSKIVPLITSSPNYQSGNTVIFITNDEGSGSDYAVGENCSSQALSASQPSCHVPTIVVAPYTPAGTADSTFYTHYSMLRTTEELLGLPLLGAAATANSMTANFNLGQVSDNFPAPSAPTSLTAQTVSSAKVNLSWTASNPGSVPISGYQIIRNGSVIATTSGAATTYSDTSANAGMTYAYSVASVDSVSNVSAPSNTVTVSTPADVNLLSNPGFETWSSGAPAGWYPYGSDTTLTQSSNAHSGSSSVAVATTSSGYAAAGLNDGSASRPTIGATVAGTTYTASCWFDGNMADSVNMQLREGSLAAVAAIMTLPTYGNWYELQVSDTAVKGGDSMRMSVYSTATSAGGFVFDVDDCSLAADTAPADTPPSAPTNLSATAISPTQVNLSWTAATPGTLPVSGYQVVRNGSIIATTSGSGTSFSDPTVSASTTYTYDVIAVDGAGNTSSPSNTASVTTPTPEPPSAPADLTAAALSPVQVDLTWTASTPGSAPVSDYQVYSNGTLIGTATSTSYTDNSVMPDTSYSYYVTAVDANNLVSPASNTAAVTTPPAVPPSAPTNLVAVASSPTQVNLSWTAATPGSEPISGYQIVRNGSVIATTNASATTFSDSTVSADTSYNYTVAAVDSLQDLSGPSNTASTITPASPTPPSAPTNLGATAVGPTQVNLSWTAATPGSAPISEYQVDRNGSLIATVAGTSYNDSALNPNTTYSYTVTAVDANGLSSPASSSASATTAPAVPPSAPANLTASASSTTNVNLSWTAATPGTEPISDYQVVRNGTVIATTTGTTYSDSTVSGGNSYNYDVIAVDSLGDQSGDSNTATVAVPANLLTNPNFELWSSGLPTGWYTYGPDTTLTQVNAGYSGSNSAVKIATTSSSYAASGINAGSGSTPLINSTVAGVAYTGSCWVKASALITINIQFHEVTKSWVSISPAAITSLKLPSTSNWYQIQVSYTTVGSGNMLPFTIYSTNTISGGATWEADDCSLTATP